jgi:hypothetical protein
MKYIKVILVSLTIFVLISSCKKIDKFTQFDMSFDEPMTLPAVPIILTAPIYYDVNKNTNSSSIFSDNNTAKNLIEEIILNEATITITTPEGSNFIFLETVRFFLDTDDNRDEEVLIASKMSISDSIGDELILDIVGQDLAPYLKEEEIVLRVEVDTDEVVPEELHIMIHINFHVDAKILGV